MNNSVDPIDMRIIRSLQKNAKQTIKELASQLGMTTTPVYERIKKLEREGIILSYSAKVNNAKLGYSLIAFCSVSLEKHNAEFIEEFKREVLQLDQVLECYHIAGMFDYLLKICVRDMIEYQEFVSKKLAKVKNIGRVQSSFVMNEIKCTNLLSEQ